MSPYEHAVRQEQIASLRRQHALSADADPNRRDDIAALIGVLVAAGLTQIEVADRIGISRSNISRLATGDDDPPSRHLPRSRLARTALRDNLRALLADRIAEMETAAETPTRSDPRTRPAKADWSPR